MSKTETTSQKVQITCMVDSSIHIMPLDHARMSKVFSNMIDDIGEEDGEMIELHITKIKGSTMKMIVAFCAEFPDNKIYEGVSLEQLFGMTLASNFIDLQPMLDMCTKTVAELIKKESPEDIRKIFSKEAPEGSGGSADIFNTLEF